MGEAREEGADRTETRLIAGYRLYVRVAWQPTNPASRRHTCSSPSFFPRLPTFQSPSSTTTIARLPRTRSKERRNVVARVAFKEIVP